MAGGGEARFRHLGIQHAPQLADRGAGAGIRAGTREAAARIGFRHRAAAREWRLA
jgi:hypothetical protein